MISGAVSRTWPIYQYQSQYQEHSVSYPSPGGLGTASRRWPAFGRGGWTTPSPMSAPPSHIPYILKLKVGKITYFISSASLCLSSLVPQYSALPRSLWYLRPWMVRYSRMEALRDAVDSARSSPSAESASSSSSLFCTCTSAAAAGCFGGDDSWVRGEDCCCCCCSGSLSAMSASLGR